MAELSLARAVGLLAGAVGAGQLAGADESYVNAVRRFAIPPEKARQVVELFSRWQPVGMSLDTGGGTTRCS